MSGLVGAAIGALAAFGGTIVTQTGIDRRERANRDQREARVRALFKSYTQSVAIILTWQVESAAVREMGEFDRRLAPLKSAAATESLLLPLEPAVIEKVTHALDMIDLNIRTARQEIARHEARMERAAVGDALLQIEDQLCDVLRAIFQRSWEAFGDALVALEGERPANQPPPPDDPVAPPTHVYLDEIEDDEP